MPPVVVQIQVSGSYQAQDSLLLGLTGDHVDDSIDSDWQFRLRFEIFPIQLDALLRLLQGGPGAQ